MLMNLAGAGQVDGADALGDEARDGRERVTEHSGSYRRSEKEHEMHGMTYEMEETCADPAGTVWYDAACSRILR